MIIIQSLKQRVPSNSDGLITIQTNVQYGRRHRLILHALRRRIPAKREGGTSKRAYVPCQMFRVSHGLLNITVLIVALSVFNLFPRGCTMRLVSLALLSFV